MHTDIDKTVIRIVQDYCFKNSAINLINEFVLTITPSLVASIENGNLALSDLRKILQKRKDFFFANDLDINLFCKGLYKKLNYELSFYADISFYKSILIFKQKVENGNFRGFPKASTSEDTLRSTLSIYIQQETFCEPRSGAGNNDITVPTEKVIIETKLWKGNEYYNSGFPELNDYLKKANYNEGYYIVFDYNQKPNKVIQENGEVFDKQYEGKLIHIFFVIMNPVTPSQLYKTSKEKS